MDTCPSTFWEIYDTVFFWWSYVQFNLAINFVLQWTFSWVYRVYLVLDNLFSFYLEEIKEHLVIILKKYFGIVLDLNNF